MIDRMLLESNQLPEKPELGILLKGCVTDAERKGVHEAFTHAECRAIAARVRELQKTACLVSCEEHQVVCLDRLNLTESQRGDAINYCAAKWWSFTGALEEASGAARSDRV
jgi:hypothetical protein